MGAERFVARSIALYAAIFLMGIPQQLQQYNELTGIALSIGFGNWSSAGLRAALDALGVSVGFYGALSLASNYIVTVGFASLGALLFWKRSDEWIGLFTSLFLVTFGIVSNNSFTVNLNGYSAAAGWLTLLVSLPWLMFYMFFYIFPDGRFVPRWTAILLTLFFIFIVLLSFTELPTVLYPVFLVIAFSSAAFAQVYRYFRASNPLQRAQTKWVMYAITVIAMGELVGQGALRLVFPEFVIEGPTRLVYELWIIVLTPFFLILPLALTIAILRYRLFDIDLIIRRTLTYALVTALLGVVFFGSVILLQQLFAGLTGSGQNEIVTVLSTLAIAALFVPLRNWIQMAIDRRFNRKRYNAQQVLADFATTVCDETDLEKLTARLMQVVDETMQPKSMSMWLNKGGQQTTDGRQHLK